MILRRLLRSLPLLVSLTVAIPAAAETAPQNALDCPSISQLAREFLKHHVIQSALGTEIEQRAIESYLHRLDTSRSLMLDGEVSELRAKLAGVFENLQAGNCSQIAGVHERLIALQAASEAHAKALVADENFKLDESVEIRIDPEQRGYPKTNDDRNELWRKLVHFQMSNYLGAGEKLPEAKRLLAHRYELRTKRLRELPQWEIYSIFLDSFATALDPHSNYLSPEAVEDFRISMSLSLEGIGVALSERDGYSVVERIIPGGAADRIEKGLEPNDKIIAVAEEGGESVNIVDMPLREAVSLIRGKKGTKVHLTVLRQGDETQRFPARDRARQDRSRRAGGEPALRDARAQRQAVQARDHRPALVLRRPGPEPAPVHRRRREPAQAGEGGEGRRPAARPVAQRRRPARARGQDLGLLHPQGRGGRGAELARPAQRALRPR
jgi:carboxyl-terminal processing protease